jgi:hypothetical protein
MSYFPLPTLTCRQAPPVLIFFCHFFTAPFTVTLLAPRRSPSLLPFPSQSCSPSLSPHAKKCSSTSSEPDTIRKSLPECNHCVKFEADSSHHHCETIFVEDFTPFSQSLSTARFVLSRTWSADKTTQLNHSYSLKCILSSTRGIAQLLHSDSLLMTGRMKVRGTNPAKGTPIH